MFECESSCISFKPTIATANRYVAPIFDSSLTDHKEPLMYRDTHLPVKKQDTPLRLVISCVSVLMGFIK
jgi:hypothetical protein